MYRAALGFVRLGHFEDHEGFDGVMLGPPNGEFHFEFTYCRTHPVDPTPTPEDLLVFYIPERHRWESRCNKMLSAGFIEVDSLNPYWARAGRTFEDADGYRVVLQCDTWTPAAATQGAAMNRDSYNAVADDWDTARSRLFPHEPPFLKVLTANLRPPARILDLGCGTGRPIAEFLLQQGHAVTGVDQAANLLALAKERLPEGRWLLAQMECFEPDEEYDGAVIWDSLFHVPREHHEPILRKVVRNLRPRSRLMLSVGGSDHPPFIDDMYGQPFFYDSHTPDAVVSLLKSLGAVIEHAEFINAPTTGRDKGRYGIVASLA